MVAKKIKMCKNLNVYHTASQEITRHLEQRNLNNVWDRMLSRLEIKKCKI